MDFLVFWVFTARSEAQIWYWSMSYVVALCLGAEKIRENGKDMEGKLRFLVFVLISQLIPKY